MRIRRAGFLALSAALTWSTAPAAPNVLELQSFSATQSGSYVNDDGKEHAVHLTNLNRSTNVWYVLQRVRGRDNTTYHIENNAPDTQTLELAAESPRSIVLRNGEFRERCDLWSSRSPDNVERARKSGKPFAPLCGGRLHLRNATVGSRTRVETVTSFLRDNVWGGEQFIGLVKTHVMTDAFLEEAQVTNAAHGQGATHLERSPLPAALRGEPRTVAPGNLGISVTGQPGGYTLGQWYRSRNVDSVFVSVMQPGAVSESILNSNRNRANALDRVESGALVYLVAFDLERYALEYALGTEHPRLGWSARVPATSRTRGAAGPDGIGDHRPLVRTGVVPPRDSKRTVAAFTGGFKRRHGGFKYGALAQRNRGSH
ncbi:MAG: hypothetical protein ACR2RL_25490, partial [Gammaproteobacteria bacterium]